MVFKNIDRIKTALPEVIHVAMFYNNGVIVESTFESEINIPKLGENIAGTLNCIKKVYEICNFTVEDYKNLIFETEDMSTIILKLGEESNIALFFKKEKNKELKLNGIRRYLDKIEELIDIDKHELNLQELSVKKEDLKRLNNSLQLKLNQIQDLQNELISNESSLSDEEQKDLTKKINITKEEGNKLNQEIEQRKVEIKSLKNKIDAEEVLKSKK